MATYEGHIYQDESGRWGWYLTEDGEQVQSGAGHASSEEAYKQMYDELCRYQGEGGCCY